MNLNIILFAFILSPNSTVNAPNVPSLTFLYAYISSYILSLILIPILDLLHLSLRVWIKNNKVYSSFLYKEKVHVLFSSIIKLIEFMME
jgi:hypothetical protein